MSSTIDIPCGVFLDVPAEQEEHKALFCDNDDDSHAATAGPPKSRQHGSDGRRGGGTEVSIDVGCEPQDRAVPPKDGGGHDDGSTQRSESGAAVDDDGYPDNIEDFMATLLDGMKSDSVQLATSARNVVANTYQVGVVAVGFVCGSAR